MTKERLETYRAQQRFIKILFLICGCWYMPTKSGKSRYFWPICVFLSTFIYVTIGLNMSYAFRHHLLYFIKGLITGMAAFGSFLKVGIFLLNRGSLIKYHQMLNDLFEEELARNEKIRTIMLSTLPAIRIVTHMYTLLLVSAVMAYIMPPNFFIIRNLYHSRLTTNYTLPLSKGHGYLWTVPDNFLYHVHLFLETFTVLLTSFVASTIDSTFAFYVYQFAATMRAMIFRLTNPLPTEKLSDILKTCVEKHQKLLLCRDTLEYIYSPIILWHIITNALIFCVMINEFLAISASSFYVFVTYSTVKLSQTLMYAWYGSILTSASEDFRNGIYFSEWFNSNTDRQVKANIILMMMQKPMALNAFFISVDAVMFTNFVNTSMSYLCLLQSVSNDK